MRVGGGNQFQDARLLSFGQVANVCARRMSRALRAANVGRTDLLFVEADSFPVLPQAAVRLARKGKSKRVRSRSLKIFGGFGVLRVDFVAHSHEDRSDYGW